MVRVELDLGVKPRLGNTPCWQMSVNLRYETQVWFEGATETAHRTKLIGAGPHERGLASFGPDNDSQTAFVVSDVVDRKSNGMP
jgi:hypothetical protein